MNRTEPSPWVVRFAPLVPAGAAVLDLACGAGRHTRLFVDRGHAVTAIDRDLTDLGDFATEPAVEAIVADLENGPWPLGRRAFAGVVVTNYLHRALFADIARAVAPGGVLIYQTFARGNEAYDKPRNPDHLLEPGELLAAFGGEFCVVAYEHGYQDRPRPSVVQRLCALNPENGQAPLAPPLDP